MMDRMISIGFGPQVCGELAEGARREWLVTDGRGGYAMGTVSLLRTRRYHGLLITAGDPVAARQLALVSLDPVLELPGGAQVRLATHEWASGAVAPAGHAYLERFDLIDGLPRWRWRVGGIVLQRELAMAYGRPVLAVVDRLLAAGTAAGTVTVRLDALCTWRDAHGERTAAGPAPRMAAADQGVIIEDAYRLAGPGWQPAGQWWHGVHHREEAARGLTPVEDLWHAGSFAATLAAGEALAVTAWAGELADPPPPAGKIVATARERRQTLAARAPDPVAATLTVAADAFIVDTGRGPDVVAGYPWFGSWSRDTMIAYEGLFLAAGAGGRADEGRRLLRNYAGTLSEGMLANTADTGQVEYNTADGTLWFVHAVDRHVARTGDDDLAAELLPALRAVIDAHVAGTRYGIRVDPADGLLTQGAPGEALTWMDARVGGVPVTPRAGKAVEINALWVNALGAAAELARRTGADPADFIARREATVAAFRRTFPAPGGGLYDMAGGGAACRPNQLLAYGLPYPPMPPDPAAVRAVGAALLTPLGLRSLAPGDPAYLGRHQGDPAARDRAYHQGTVWPWLLGPYADAAAAAGLPRDGLLAGIVAHLGEWGLGSVSETADGDQPHTGTGCPFQAWSVAESLRIHLG